MKVAQADVVTAPVSPMDVYAACMSAAIQVAAVNALRGLLAAEVELNPETHAICVVLSTDGSMEVTCTSTSGHPIGGYML